MSSWIVLLFGVFGLSSFVFSDIQSLTGPISLDKDGLTNWNSELAEKTLSDPQLKQKGLMECAEVKELKGTLLCASSKKVLLNKAMLRATLFSEGDAELQKGTVQSTESKFYSGSLTEILGHDIPSSELLGFWSQLEQACRRKEMCATPEEEELFKEVLLPFSQNHESFVLISYVTNGDWLMTLNHELLHAQYFKDENFRKTVDEFWNEKITKEDKEKIKTILGVAYNKNDEFLIRNEFQAFLLGAPASLRARQVLRPTLPVEFKTSTFSGAMFWFP